MLPVFLSRRFFNEKVCYFNKRKILDAKVISKIDFLNTGMGKRLLTLFPMNEPAKSKGKNKAVVWIV